MLLKESSVPDGQHIGNTQGLCGRRSLPPVAAPRRAPCPAPNVGETPASLLRSLTTLGMFSNFRDSQEPQNNSPLAYFGSANVKPRAGMDVFTHSVFTSLHFCQLLFKPLPMFCSFSI